MKRERFEARGVTAAVITSTVAPSGDAALDGLIGRAEQSFFDGAKKIKVGFDKKCKTLYIFSFLG